MYLVETKQKSLNETFLGQTFHKQNVNNFKNLQKKMQEGKQTKKNNNQRNLSVSDQSFVHVTTNRRR